MVLVMIGYGINRDLERTALAVLLACCLLIQTIVTGLVIGASTEPASDLLSELSVICSSRAGGPDADQPSGQPSLPDKSCLAHCLGVIASGAPAAFHRLALPAYVSLTQVEVFATDQVVRDTLARSGLGARAPPSFVV